jgi:gas vesicle protein
MTKKEKIITGILIGAAAGVAAVIFFQTEKGKKLLETLKELGSKTVDDAVERLVNMETELKDKLT